MPKSQRKKGLPNKPAKGLAGELESSARTIGRRPRTIILSALGNAIKDGRTRRAPAPSQEKFAGDVAAELLARDANFKISETLLARLERGGIQDPDPEVLAAIATVLGEDYTALVGHLVAQKYDIDPVKLAPLFRGPITMAQLARWEATQREFWVVATDIVDARDPQFAAAVRNVVVDHEGEAVFFIPADLLPRFATIKGLAFSNVSDPTALARLTAVPLQVQQQAVLTTSFIIGNPSGRYGTKSIGYLILNDENAKPCMAFQMYESETSNTIGNLRTVLQEHLNKTSQAPAQ